MRNVHYWAMSWSQLCINCSQPQVNYGDAWNKRITRSLASTTTQFAHELFKWMEKDDDPQQVAFYGPYVEHTLYFYHFIFRPRHKNGENHERCLRCNFRTTEKLLSSLTLIHWHSSHFRSPWITFAAHPRTNAHAQPKSASARTEATWKMEMEMQTIIYQQ